MCPVLLSGTAVADLSLTRQHSTEGFGLVSGMRMGQNWVISGFHLLGSYSGALQSYLRIDTGHYREYLGLFSCGCDTLPELEHSGLFIHILEDNIRFFLCQRRNGGLAHIVEELEGDHERGCRSGDKS